MKNSFYDRLWATRWGDLQFLGPVHRHLQQHLVKTLSNLPVRHILEVGCGSGNNLAALASYGDYDLTGADIAKEALDLAAQRAPHARLITLDIEREALSEQFDLVMSLQVLEHILDDISAIRNMAIMSRSYLLISTMQGRMRHSESAIGHVRNYSAMELRRKLEVVGLQVLKIWGWGFPFYSPLYRSLAEWLPGGPPLGPMGRWNRLFAMFLYNLYRFNLPGRGDVLFVLAKKT